MVLLFASIVYYLIKTDGKPVKVLFPVGASFVTWGLLKLLSKTGEEELGKRRRILAAELVVLLGILIAFKVITYITGVESAPDGLSFYTFILLGYFI